MSSLSSVKAPEKQQGLALLVLIIVIVLAFSAYSLSGLSINQVKTDSKVQTRLALKKAKEALIAYAISFPEITPSNRGPGYLPCPDLNNKGTSTPVGCNPAGIVNTGRLPWVTLGIDDLRDGDSERLWYAVSENFDYTNSPSVNKINTATVGTITVRDNNNNLIYDGTSLDAVVAVVIAPGQALIRDDGVAQDRSVASSNIAINYLDIDTSSGEDNASFQHGTLDGFIEGEIKNANGNTIVNDQFIVITYGEIMEAVHKRVSSEIRDIVKSYFTLCNAYPEAADFDPAGTFDSVPLKKEGFLPIGGALPFNWNTDSSPNCDLTGLSIPSWFIAEDWHQNTYYEYAYTNPVITPPTSNGVACIQGADCLTVIDADGTTNNNQALIVIAGRATIGGRPSTNTSKYFEGENDDNNITMDGLTYDSIQMEDYVRVILP